MSETVSLKRDEIVEEGKVLAALAPNVVVKVPAMPEALAATRALFDLGIKVNMTLCFTVPQSILAASDCTVGELLAMKDEIVALRDRLNAVLGE